MGPDAALSTEDVVATAEESSPTSAPKFVPVEVEKTPPASERVYTEEDLALARRQEKEKLYPELSRLKDELSEFRKEREAEQARLEAERAALEEEARRKQEEEMDVRQLLQQKEKEWQERLEAERVERERAIALLEKERQVAELQAYRARRLEEVREDILPELVDLISGESPEQIEASIAGLIERSSRILASAQQAAQSVRRDMSGPRVTAPSTGPLEDYTGTQQITPDQIRDMSMDEFAQYRSSLLGTEGSGRGTGLFG